MTFCIGIRVREGLIALADTQVVRGSEQVTKHKLSVVYHGEHPFLVMTSGLRSVRDKTVTYLTQKLEESGREIDKLSQLVNLFGEYLRRVRLEDGPALSAGGLSFNTHAIIGGRLSADKTLKMYYVYPEGNWLEATADSPYFVVGRSQYSKFFLDSLLRHDTDLRRALGLALVAFDTTRRSVTDVDFPIDVGVIVEGSEKAVLRRYTQPEVAHTTGFWVDALAQSASLLPTQWSDDLFSEL